MIPYSPRGEALDSLGVGLAPVDGGCARHCVKVHRAAWDLGDPRGLLGAAGAGRRVGVVLGGRAVLPGVATGVKAEGAGAKPLVVAGEDFLHLNRLYDLDIGGDVGVAVADLLAGVATLLLSHLALPQARVPGGGGGGGGDGW